MFKSFKATIFLSLLIVFSFQTTLAQSKQPITHEAMWMMKRVGAPIPSPDGKWIVFSLTEPSYDEREQVSDLWIVPSDASAKPRRLTFSKSGEGGAAWSPDSRRIAFTARREGDEASQVYVIDIANGGEAQRVTNISTGARAPQWSPDGRAILFVSSVYPGAMNDDENKKIAAERRNRKYRARVYDSFPIRYWDRWLDDMQTHVFVQSLEVGAKAKDLLAGTKLVTEKGFGGQLGNSGDELSAVWSPDGQSILFVATTDRNKAAHAETTAHIFQVATNGSEPKQITNARGNHSRPTFSPDGKTLYFGFEPITEKVFNQTRLASMDWSGMSQPKILTANFDRAVGSFAIAPDSKTVFLTAEDAGLEKLYSVSSSGGNVTLAMDMTKGCYTNLVIPSKTSSPMLFVNWDSAINPPEVFRLNLETKIQTALTNFNEEALAKLDIQPVRHFWFKSKAGKSIHNMIALPPNFDVNKKYPLFVIMHGGPHTMFRDNWGLRWNYHLMASPGYVVLLTNYTGSTGFGEKFAQEIQGDPFLTPANEINEGADEAIKQFSFVDGTRQAAAGASYGGHLANWMLATTIRYKCLVSHAGLINLESQWGTSDIIYSRERNNGGPPWEQAKTWREQNPIRFGKNFKTPILVTVGENDFRVPLNQSLENWSAIQRMQVPSRLIIFPEENHWILKGENSRYFYQEVHAWLKKWLN
jgi:dipeptidyl aminopeptidase/acylaminoacyl peptidase